MPPATSHCRSQQCLDSAQMMCDHEAVLSMQYQLDNLKIALAKFQPQDLKRERMSMLYFDHGMFSHEFDKKLCNSANLRGIPAPMHKQRLNEQYVPACSSASFKNNIVQTPTMACSYSHQLFSNHTRAGTGRLAVHQSPM